MRRADNPFPVCARCNKPKEQAEFYRRPDGAPTSDCRECVKIRVAEWRKRNPGARSAEAKRARERDPEKVRRQKLAAYYRSMERDPEKVRARRRDWAKTPQGVIANRLARHKRRGATPDALAKEWAAILLADPCSYCGAPATELDHIDPISLGGDGSWENLTGGCRVCNAGKHDDRLVPFLMRKVA